MRKIYVIGIGAGDPEHLTLQAIRAIGAADVFFLLDKGEQKDSMIALRRQILAEHASRGHRVARGRDPERDRSPADYTGTIADWRRRRGEAGPPPLEKPSVPRLAHSSSCGRSTSSGSAPAIPTT